MSVDGVITAEVSYDDERADVRYRLGLVEPEVLVKAIEEAGFQASVASVIDGVSGSVAVQPHLSTARKALVMGDRGDGPARRAGRPVRRHPRERS